MNYTVVGKSIKRKDARAKVTGTAQYLDDLFFPKMLHMKVKRAGIPHGIIKCIDISEAEAINGVHKIITRNTPGLNKQMLIGTCIFDQPPIAFDKVRHAGEVVAVVLAKTKKIARKAIDKIKVEYEELPFVLTGKEATHDDAPIIHENNANYKRAPIFTPIPDSNVFFEYNLKKGDATEPFKDADVIVEDEYEYPLVNHAAIEPHGGIARWDTTGELHVWSTTQAPYVVREVLADMFGILMTKIHVHTQYLGGGFGGKSDYTIEPLLAVVSQQVPGYHVKFVLTRQEVFTGTLLGRGMQGTMRLGAKKDGSFVGLTATQYYTDGAYGDTSCNVVLAGGHNCAGPYHFDNCNLKSYGVYTNTTPVGAFRGYGHPEGQFMIERLIEKLSKKLNIDSKEIRRKNFLQSGDTNSLNMKITEHNGNIRQCFDAVVTKLEEQSLPNEDNKYLYGRGIIALVKSPVQATNASSCVYVKVNEDLSVIVNIGGVEMGQGATTVLAQIAAEVLQFPIDVIQVNHKINTHQTPYEWQTVASMTTMRVGNAIIQACEKVIDQFKRNAASAFGCNPTEIKYDGTVARYNDKAISLKKLVLGYTFEDGHTLGDPVSATGCSVVRNVTLPDPETGQYQPYEWTFGAQGCDIQISKESGEIEVLRFITALDVGKVINPETAKGQIYGGVMQGIGQALSEKIEYNPETGTMKTIHLRKYNIPRFSAMPEYECIFIENNQPNGPFGARPIAEHPVIGPPPAILNALEDATGESLTSLPATSKRVKQILERRHD